MRNAIASVVTVLAVAGSALAANWSENFDSIGVPSPVIPAGWSQVNNSAPATTLGWFPQTGFGVPPGPHAGANAIAANFQAGSGVSDLSVWLISPVATYNDGDQITFWTRSLNGTVPGSAFADRMQVRLSTNGGSSAGAGFASVGDFTTLLLDINPTLVAIGAGAYPTAWTQFSITLAGLPGGSASGSLAFRYFVPGGGPAGDNSNAILLDTVNVVPTPGAVALLGLGGLIAGRRRRA